MKFGWRGALGIAISVVLLWYTLRGEDIGRIWSVLSHSNGLLWIVTAFFATITVPLRARRWEALLEPVVGRRLHFSALWHSTAVGVMVNNVAPARAGEFARAFALSRQEPEVKFTAAFASLAVDRLFDGTILLLMMVVAMLDPAFVKLNADSTQLFLWMRFTTAFLVVVLAILALLVWAPQRVFAMYDGTVGRVFTGIGPKGRHLLEGFASGLGVLRSPKLMAEVFFWTVLHWASNGFAFWLGFKALGIEVPATAALLLQGIIAIGVAVPSSPGFFGAFEYFGKLGLGLYGTPSDQAVSWVIGYHVVSYIPITVIGAWYLTRLKLHFRDFSGADTAPPA
ncbi:MAG: flippase-like domain-containing protein [Gemmatimonadetes bacterium]|nr:flippase-like domain-containing protein [Gemmatimonadota bacterium]MBI3568466.1 flippase-like domain-containing protein [Gemmatimonadota bacterium]